MAVIEHTWQGGDWPEIARRAAVELSAKAAENNPISALLFAIWLSFRAAGGGRIFSRILVQGLNQMEDRPWGAMRKGKGMTADWLAKELERFGIRPRKIRIGEVQAKVLRRGFQGGVCAIHVPRRSGKGDPS
jgi:hypothetical protein